MEDTSTLDTKADLASVGDLAAFFRINRAVIPGLMRFLGVPRRGKGFPWIRIWLALGVETDTAREFEPLKDPLLELKEVAALLDESPKTTRRRSDGKHNDKTIPAHIDLGPRKRLFFGSEIRSWIRGEPKPFERRQSNLSYTPEKRQENNPEPRPDKAPSLRTASQGSAANLFMAPPPPV